MDIDDRGSVIDVIIWEVAEERGVDPLHLDSIYSVVDPDALQSVIEESDDVSKVQFTYGGCEVIVEDNNHVRVFSKA